MLASALLALGIISRLIIHLPNFTPVIAVALFSGCVLKRNQAFLYPLVLMAITDVFLGAHETILFTYGSIVLIIGMGLLMKNRMNLKNIIVASLFADILFFVITNFGVWVATNIYPHTWDGLVECFIMALPFFQNSLLSTFIYAFLLFGSYEYLTVRLKGTRFATVL